jgi:hypothetical protein
MGRMSFVAWLFIVAASCLILAVVNSSLAWLIGGAVLFSVAIYAFRQFKKEEGSGREGVSISFFGVAVLLMIVAMLFLFWFQFKA